MKYKWKSKAQDSEMYALEVIEREDDNERVKVPYALVTAKPTMSGGMPMTL